MASRLRLAIGLFALLGCTSAPPQPPPAPPLPPAPVVEAREPEPAAPQPASRAIEICILHQGKLMDVQGVETASGDTLVGGRPVGEVYPDTGQYAATRAWYVNSETIDYDPANICYVKYGLPRYLERREVARLGEWRGVPVFRERVEQGDPSVIYVPTSRGCAFQPYQFEPTAPPRACPQPEYQFQVP